MKTFLLLLNFLLVACGSPETASEIKTFNKEPIKIDSRLQPLVDEFLLDCAKYDLKAVCDNRLEEMSSIEVSKDQPVKNADGACYRSGSIETNDFKPIKIVIHERWIKANNYLRALVYHELGHCVLAKGHTDVKKWGDPSDDPLMNRQLDFMVNIAFMQGYKIPRLFTVTATSMD